MGGTTAKLAMVEGGAPLIAYQFEASRAKRFAEGSGLPINISTIELIEIGAGGGSIADIDALGLLKVGPRSAGAAPGPACYGRGGDQATVTDANLVLGFLDPATFAGGTMTIDRQLAEAAIQPLAKKSGLRIADVAWGIHSVVNENMAAAARVHVAERGHHASQFALLATGGGGPLHACEVAKRLGISRSSVRRARVLHRRWVYSWLRRESIASLRWRAGSVISTGLRSNARFAISRAMRRK